MKRTGRLIKVFIPHPRYIRAVQLARRRGCGVETWLSEIIDNALADLPPVLDDPSRFTERKSWEWEYEV